jgi:hypothetical protein
LVIGFCAVLIPPYAIWRHVARTGSMVDRGSPDERSIASSEISSRL